MCGEADPALSYWLRLDRESLEARGLPQEKNKIAFTIFWRLGRFELSARGFLPTPVEWEVRFRGSGRRDKRVGDASAAFQAMREAALRPDFKLRTHRKSHYDDEPAEPTPPTYKFARRFPLLLEPAIYKVRLLLIAANNTFTNVLRKSLEGEGFIVNVLENYDSIDELYAELQREVYDAVLPTNFGVDPRAIPQVILGIKERFPRVFVLVLSGASTQDFVTHLETQGADGFIKAPFDIKELIRRLRELQANRQKEIVEEIISDCEIHYRTGGVNIFSSKAYFDSFLDREVRLHARGRFDFENAKDIFIAWATKYNSDKYNKLS